MKLENLMYKSGEEKTYTIGDLEYLSASQLYSSGPFNITPSEPLNIYPKSNSIILTDFSNQFSLLDNYGKKESTWEKMQRELKEGNEMLNESMRKMQEKEREESNKKVMEYWNQKKSEPLKDSFDSFKFSGNKMIFPYGNLGFDGLNDLHDTFEVDRYGNIYGGHTTFNSKFHINTDPLKSRDDEVI